MMRAKDRARHKKVRQYEYSQRVRLAVFPGTWHSPDPTTILVLTAVVIRSQSQTMACTRSALLERRSDLPLCSLRQVRQLCAGNRAAFSSTGLDNAARDTRSLLQTPLKVGTCTRSLQQPDAKGTKKTSSVPTHRGGSPFYRKGWQLERPGCC